MEVKRFSQDECVVNQKVAGTIVVPGFGASDCRRHCGSHLKRIADSEIRQRREEMGSKKSK
jgi:Uri superfamily endonuclease